MISCILCLKKGKRNKFCELDSILYSGHTVFDSITQQFPFIDAVFSSDTQLICLECYGILKNYHELVNSVKQNYNFEEFTVKCESIDENCLTVQELPEIPVKTEFRDELVEYNFVKPEVDFYELTPKTSGKRKLPPEKPEIPSKRKPPLDRQPLPPKKPPPKKKPDDDVTDKDYFPASMKKYVRKTERVRRPDDDPARIELRHRKALWDTDNQKIKDFMQLQCYICKITLETYREVQKHFKSTHPGHNKKYLMCCGTRYQRQHLLRHIDTHMSIFFYCDLCPSRSKDIFGLRNHMKNNHMGDQTPKTCKICEKVCKNQYFLDQHLRLHLSHEINSDKTFECYKCQKMVSNYNNLKSHLSTKHSLKIRPQIICEICSKILKSLPDLKSHMERHMELSIIERGNGFKCNQCNKIFAYQKKLEKHVAKVHNRKREKFICEICSKELSSEGSMKNHLEAVHGAEKPRVPCPVCGFMMKHKNSLRKHMRERHTMQKQQFPCPICGKTYSSKDTLWNHNKLIHKLQRNIPCSYCPKMLITDLDRREHEATHTGIDLYSCEFCPMTFKFGASYRGHRKRNHPEEYEKFKPVWKKKVNE